LEVRARCQKTRVGLAEEGADPDLGGRDGRQGASQGLGHAAAVYVTVRFLRYCCLPSRSRVRHRDTECRRAGTIDSADCTPSHL